MACDQCVGCGKCEVGQIRAKLATPGFCSSCGYQNEPNAIKCEQCGRFFPLPPGQKR